MNDVTQLLNAIENGDPKAAAELLPLLYDKLRRLAAQKMAQEAPGHTLDATALVHEAYLRLVASGGGDSPGEQHWNSRRHFYAAAAEAMRRILVDNARRKKRLRHGGERERVDLPEELIQSGIPEQDVLAVHDALDQFAQQDARTAELVKLHFFAGLTLEQAAESLGISPRTAYRDWDYARAWLSRRLSATS